MSESANSPGATVKVMRPVTEKLKRKLHERLLADTVKRSRLLQQLQQQLPICASTTTTSSSRCGEQWLRHQSASVAVNSYHDNQSSTPSDNSSGQCNLPASKHKLNKKKNKRKTTGISDQAVSSCEFLAQQQQQPLCHLSSKAPSVVGVSLYCMSVTRLVSLVTASKVR